jgi:thiamine pyrophosphate-dependent acetolactate synthase large subunit-like protein
MKNQIFGEKARGRNLGTDITQPHIDFCRIAEGMGVKAQMVENSSLLKSSLHKAFNLNQVNLVEVRIK